MAEENSKYKEPEFIVWDKRERVFRPAKFIIPKDYVGLDLERNIEMENGPIDPIRLHLIASHYLGPVNISHKRQKLKESDETFYFRQTRLQGIMGSLILHASRIAEKHRVPYFSLTNEVLHRDREFDFTGENELENIASWRTSLGDSSRKDKDSALIMGYVLHPTAQLYILNKDR